MKKLYFILALFTFTSLSAQSTFTGTIIQSIEYDNMSPEIKAYASMLPTETTTTHSNGLTKSVTPNAMGETTILVNSETGEMISLVNQAGQMIGIRSNTNDKKEKDEEEPEVEYIDEEKEILGHKCKKALISNDEYEMIFYYTDELPELESTNSSGVDIKGFVMQTIIENEQFLMTTTVSEIKKEKVKKIKMEIPSEYKEMTLEEIKEMQQGGM